MPLIIADEDVPEVIEGLRHAARDQRNFFETIGQHEPPDVIRRGLEKATGWDRIAGALESNSTGA